MQPPGRDPRREEVKKPGLALLPIFRPVRMEYSLRERVEWIDVYLQQMARKMFVGEPIPLNWPSVLEQMRWEDSMGVFLLYASIHCVIEPSTSLN